MELDGLLCEVCERNEATHSTAYGFYCEKCFDALSDQIEEMEEYDRHLSAGQKKNGESTSTEVRNKSALARERRNRRLRNRDRYS